MLGKMAKSAPRPAFGPPEGPVAACTSRLSCRKVGNTRIFTPDRESSGESRINTSLPSEAEAHMSIVRSTARTSETPLSYVILTPFGQPWGLSISGLSIPSGVASK